jgi:hypothetical protein
MQIKRLIRNINMLNVVFLNVALFFAFYLFFPALDITAGFTLPSVNKYAPEKEETGMDIRIPSITEYTKITEENLFHPERRIPVEKKADQQQQPQPMPEFLLYGTLITDDLRLAYIEDLKAPRNSPGRGKRQTALRKGNALSGFTLKEIEADQIVMVRGEEKIVVIVNNPSRSKETGVTTAATAATQKPPKQIPVAAQTEQRKQKARAAPQPSSSRLRVLSPGTGN